MVCGRPADADPDRAHDPDPAYSVHPESGGHACYPADSQYYGFRPLPAVLASGCASGNGPVATGVFLLACWDSVELLLAHATGQNDLHTALWSVAVTEQAGCCATSSFFKLMMRDDC